MAGDPAPTPEEYFAGNAVGSVTYEWVREAVDTWGGAEVRVTRSQVVFRRRRGFAWLWVPGRYLSRPGADVVLSFALGRAVESVRIKEVVQPRPHHWMHHLEVHDPDVDLDHDLRGWLREAYELAGGTSSSVRNVL